MSVVIRIIFWILCGICNLTILAKINNTKSLDEDGDKEMATYSLLGGPILLFALILFLLISGKFINGPIQKILERFIHHINRKDDKNV